MLSSYTNITFLQSLRYIVCECAHMHVWCVKMNVSVCISCIHIEIMCCWYVCCDAVSQHRISLAHRATVVCSFCLEISERLKRKITEHKTTAETDCEALYNTHTFLSFLFHRHLHRFRLSLIIFVEGILNKPMSRPLRSSNYNLKVCWYLNLKSGKLSFKITVD